MKTKYLIHLVPLTFVLIYLFVPRVSPQSPQVSPCVNKADSTHIINQRQVSTLPATPSGYLEDKFESLIWLEGKSYGPWFLNFNGYGDVGIEAESTSSIPNNVLYLKPKPATDSNQTHAALVTSTSTMGDLILYLRIKTVKQLRTPKPNEWETAWVIWHYRDDKHFYYFALKTNGWELGKEDPAYPGSQRFLCSGAMPKANLGAFDGIRIQQIESTIKVNVNDREILSFTDRERPYLNGKLGLYSEDAYVQFDDISARY